MQDMDTSTNMVTQPDTQAKKLAAIQALLCKIIQALPLQVGVSNIAPDSCLGNLDHSLAAIIGWVESEDELVTRYLGQYTAQLRQAYASLDHLTHQLPGVTCPSGSYVVSERCPQNWSVALHYLRCMRVMVIALRLGR
jgi:hypothetical protein